MPMHPPDLSRKHVFRGRSVVKVASHSDQKSPLPAGVISSWEVLISYRGSGTSYLCGRLTYKGDISSWFRQWMQHIGWHLPCAAYGKGKITPLFPQLPFSFVLSFHSRLLFPLSWKLSPVKSGALTNGGREMCHTAS